MIDWDYRRLPINTKTSLISAIYSKKNRQPLSDAYFAEQSILSTKNIDVSYLNILAMEQNRGSLETYASADKVISPDDACNISLEQMNAIKYSGLPPHLLQLKVGCPVMLLQSLNYSRGLCNGSRLRVRKIGRQFIECVILTGEHAGNNVLLPQIPLQNKDGNLKNTVQFTRRQFLVRLAFAMTINKSQKQSLKYVGVNFS